VLCDVISLSIRICELKDSITDWRAQTHPHTHVSFSATEDQYAEIYSSFLIWIHYFILLCKQCGPKVSELIFLKIEDTWGRHVTFLLFKISSIGIYTGFCAVVHFLKSCRKFLFFWPSLIHQLRLLGSQQHPQSWVLLTLFGTWGTENSLAEINMESTGGDKGL